MVTICDSNNKEIAKGLTNYSSKELFKIIGKSTMSIKKEFDLFGGDVVIHADNMILS